MKELIGKTVIGLQVSEGEDFLAFEHPDGTLTVYEAWGDCCSESWFADITGVDALLYSKVVDAEDVDLPQIQDDRCRQEEDAFYGVKLKTTKGYVDIVFRNSSNGYYGGKIYLSQIWPRTGVMRPITTDWQA